MKHSSGRSHRNDDKPVAQAADRYHITVKRERIDDEWYFVGRVAEFPDVAVFEASDRAAYEGTFAAVVSLLEAFRAQHRNPPLPSR
ncbi:hypothetical protein [Burkholderia cepacia]|uniref:hypothetical protein n=1 Tax=Burkholderia cepacia TaxID=292 RepID=UPI0012D9FF47|nr:hypothetical protein [Burkholderia cepacia]